LAKACCGAYIDLVSPSAESVLSLPEGGAL